MTAAPAGPAAAENTDGDHRGQLPPIRCQPLPARTGQADGLIRLSGRIPAGGDTDPITLSLVLQDVGGAWKLAGYYPRLDAIGGHDGDWYLTKAREFKAKGDVHDAWFYYLTAWDLTAPVNFMGTPQLDKIATEMQSARPSDMPSQNAPLSLSANGKVFKVTELAAVPVDNKLDLRIRYENANANNSGIAFQDNMAVIKAVVAKYPELREAFDSIIARAVDSSGQEYGTLLPVKEIK